MLGIGRAVNPQAMQNPNMRPGQPGQPTAPIPPGSRFIQPVMLTT